MKQRGESSSSSAKHWSRSRGSTTPNMLRTCDACTTSVSTPSTKMWSSRRSHEHGRGGNEQSRSTSPSGESAESHRRTSSDATPRPTPATTRFLNANPGGVDHETRSLHSADVFGSSKRLGFLADKISHTLSGTTNTHVKSQSSHLLLHPHSHSRTDSVSSPVSPSPSPVPMASPSSISNVAKSHTSPSKVHLPSMPLPQFRSLICKLVVLVRADIRFKDRHKGNASSEPRSPAVCPRNAALNGTVCVLINVGLQPSRNVAG